MGPAENQECKYKVILLFSMFSLFLFIFFYLGLPCCAWLRIECLILFLMVFFSSFSFASCFCISYNFLWYVIELCGSISWKVCVCCLLLQGKYYIFFFYLVCVLFCSERGEWVIFSLFPHTAIPQITWSCNECVDDRNAFLGICIMYMYVCAVYMWLCTCVDKWCSINFFFMIMIMAMMDDGWSLTAFFLWHVFYGFYYVESSWNWICALIHR